MEVTFLAIVLFIDRISHLYAHQHTIHPLTWFRCIDKSIHLSFCCAWKTIEASAISVLLFVGRGLAHILPFVHLFFVLSFFLLRLSYVFYLHSIFLCNLHALLLWSLNDLLYIYLFHFLPYFVLVLFYSLFIYASWVFRFSCSALVLIL